MTWHYLPSRKTHDGEEEWTLREVYDTASGDSLSWTVEAIAPAASSHAELLETLRMMLRDAERADFVDLDSGVIGQRPGGLRGRRS